MNCPQCHYLLFGLSEPRCPECGREFDVTDFAFPAGAVHFLCPYCRQAYAGNDEFGLPRPRTFECVRCHRHVSASSMSVRPAREEVSGESLRFGNVWELRQRTGVPRAFVASVAQLAVQPAEFFRLAYGSDRSAAMNFGLACGYATTVLVLLEWVIFAGLFPNSGLPTSRELLQPGTFMMLSVAVPVLLFVGAYAYAILIHLTLVCTAGPSVDFEQSVQIVAYSTAVLPALVLPPVGLVWFIATVAVGLRHMHGLSRGRALAAAIIPALFFLNVLAGGIVYFCF